MAALALVAGVATLAYVALARGPKAGTASSGAPAQATGAPGGAAAAAPTPTTAVVIKQPKAKVSPKTATKAAGTTASSNGTTTSSTTTTTTSTTSSVPPGTITIPATAVRTFNASGAAAKSFGKAAKAIDGNPLTAWSYKLDTSANGVTKVGLVISLGSRQRPRKIAVATDTPGMTVAFYGAPRTPPATFPNSGWIELASQANIAASTTVALDSSGRTFHALLVLITHAPPGVNIGQVDISELSLES